MISPNTGGGSARPKRILALASIALLISFVFGTAIHFLEPASFPSILEGIWWALVTASTVGYGDYAPVTVPGRLLGMVLIVTGIGLFTTYITTLSAAAVTAQSNYLAGRKEYHHQGHTVIIGWNERSRQTILKLKQSGSSIPIVLVDETLELNPFRDRSIHFIHGNGSHDRVLVRANIKDAASVLITAGISKDEFQCDAFTIMCLLAVKGVNPGVRCIAEILTEEQMENAKRAGADTLLRSNAVISDVMEQSLAGLNPEE
ncbi:potassium channel family protein [Peribacillus sp. SCS-37]|uniref:potassium channel family protein n=1 Tax=Paraperibacillus esterisolvens TaxID=3115296 RepID=UPI0039058010